MPRLQTINGQPAVYNETPVTWVDGDAGALNVDQFGNLRTTATLNADNLSINVDGVTHGGVEATAMQTAAVAVGNGTSIDVSGMESLILYVSGITTATITVEAELPSGTWTALVVKSVLTGQLTSTITANGLYSVHISGALNVRARISSWTSGTITITGTATAAGNHADVQNVAVRDRLDATNDAITAYPFGHSYVNLAADGLVKTGAGVLHTITFFPNDAAPTAGTIIGYDNTAESGTKIFDFSGISTTWFVPFTITLDAAFTTGLYIGFTTTADVNITVTYR